MTLADQIVSALVEITKARLADTERAVGTLALDIDFYSAGERDKPHEDFDFEVRGCRYQGFGARWCVVKQRWDGADWKRVRRLTGPLQFSAALDRLSEIAAQTGMERRR